MARLELELEKDRLISLMAAQVPVSAGVGGREHLLQVSRACGRPPVCVGKGPGAGGPLKWSAWWAHPLPPDAADQPPRTARWAPGAADGWARAVVPSGTRPGRSRVPGALPAQRGFPSVRSGGWSCGVTAKGKTPTFTVMSLTRGLSIRTCSGRFMLRVAHVTTAGDGEIVLGEA